MAPELLEEGGNGRLAPVPRLRVAESTGGAGGRAVRDAHDTHAHGDSHGTHAGEREPP
jgi:hypothetical protein